jgi:hypothetical protein
MIENLCQSSYHVQIFIGSVEEDDDLVATS